VCRGSQAWPCPAQSQRSNQFPQPEENLFPHTIKEPTRFLLCGCSDRLARSRYVQRCTGLLSYPWPYTPLKPFFTKAPGLINHRLLLRCTCSSIVCSGATELLQLDRSNHMLISDGAASSSGVVVICLSPIWRSLWWCRRRRIDAGFLHKFILSFQFCKVCSFITCNLFLSYE
jgi:hypothetical protein